MKPAGLGPHIDTSIRCEYAVSHHVHLPQSKKKSAFSVLMCIWTTTHVIVTALFPRFHVTGYLMCLVKRVPERKNFVLLVNRIPAV